MPTVFWDSQGSVLEHYQERGTTINSARYSEMLTDRLKPAIRSKRRGLLSKGVVLLHDNARPHTAAHTVETLCKLKFEVMVQPPYSPDLAPSDYHLFGPLKEALRGRRFTSGQEVKEAVYAWLAAQPKPSFRRASGSLCNDGPSALKINAVQCSDPGFIPDGIKNFNLYSGTGCVSFVCVLSYVASG